MIGEALKLLVLSLISAYVKFSIYHSHASPHKNRLLATILAVIFMDMFLF